MERRGMRSYLDAGPICITYDTRSAIVREQEEFVRERTENGEAGRRRSCWTWIDWVGWGGRGGYCSETSRSCRVGTCLEEHPRGDGAVQRSAKRWSPGLVNSVAAVAYHFCLALPAPFTQPGDHLLVEPCTLFFRKIGQFSNPPCDQVSVDVIYGWSLKQQRSGRAFPVA